MNRTLQECSCGTDLGKPVSNWYSVQYLFWIQRSIHEHYTNTIRTHLL